FIAALSLAGLPPFSGFVAKYSLILASIDAAQITAAVVMVVVSLITLLSMLKIWSGMFWGGAEDDPTPRQIEPEPGAANGGVAVQTRTAVVKRVGLRLTLPALALAAITTTLGAGGEALLSLADVAAGNLLDTTAYVEAVSKG